MLSTSDEQTIIAYILNALEESEEAEVSVRLSQDASFRRYYRRFLKSLQPILSARTIEEEEVLIRKESEGLASRTMTFLRQARESLEMASQPGMDTSEQMMETLADTCAETKVAKNAEQVHEQIHEPKYQ